MNIAHLRKCCLAAGWALLPMLGSATVFINDDFSGNVLDTAVWSTYLPEAGATVTQDDQLIFTIPPTLVDQYDLALFSTGASFPRADADGPLVVKIDVVSKSGGFTAPGNFFGVYPAELDPPFASEWWGTNDGLDYYFHSSWTGVVFPLEKPPAWDNSQNIGGVDFRARITLDPTQGALWEYAQPIGSDQWVTLMDTRGVSGPTTEELRFYVGTAHGSAGGPEETGNYIFNNVQIFTGDESQLDEEPPKDVTLSRSWYLYE